MTYSYEILYFLCRSRLRPAGIRETAIKAFLSHSETELSLAPLTCPMKSLQAFMAKLQRTNFDRWLIAPQEYNLTTGRSLK